jgi:hypothetical protein
MHRRTDVNINFTQTITMQCTNPKRLIELISEWDAERARTELTGYMGARILADREHLGRYVCVLDFGVIDPGVTAAEEAAINNDRPETKATAAAVAELCEGELEYHHFDEVYRTDR